MIEHRTGSLFDSGADALVVPVNCVGVAGKGLALEFKERWPKWFDDYVRVCQNGLLEIGVVHNYRSSNAGQFIVSFPTKRNWKDRSSILSILDGLSGPFARVDGRMGLREWLQTTWQVQSVAIPALGCGLGGLDWKDVRPLIEEALGDLETRVLLYGPKEN